MALPNYTIKPMTRRDLDRAIDWAAAEGWNPGLHDADCFYAADPNGFFMGWLGDQPVAAISALKYGETFGFVGFYLVRSAFRGHGYGLAIWQAGLDYLQGRTIGLDGVVEQQANYVKSGFELAHRNIRYAGVGSAIKAARKEAEMDGVVAMAQPSEGIAPPFLPKVTKYDQAFFPADRTGFLKSWLTQPDSLTVGLLHDQTLMGYGLIRTCREGYKIGPLFADTPQIAEAIFLALGTYISATSADSVFYLDVPETNPQAVALAERYQMTRVFETARMYCQEAPELPIDRIFGVTTFELG